MLTANQQQLCQVWPFLFDQPLTLVDWLPWNRAFGSNHNFNMVLRHAGTLVIDGGRPLPAMVGETVRNLTEISPTIYFTCRPAMRRCCRISNATRPRAILLRQAPSHLLRGRSVAAGSVGPPRSRGGAHDRPAHAHVLLVGHHRNRAARDRRASPARSGRKHRTARARCRHEARAVRRQARGSRARARHDAGLLEAAGPHAGRFDDEGFYRPGDAAGFPDLPMSRRAFCSRGGWPKISS